jgi:hypothetical protein
MAARKDALQNLHEVLANTLADAITQGIPIKDEETGEVHKAPAPAAILSVARQFLKDNNIEAVAVPGKPLHSIASSLPFAGSEEAEDRESNYTAH